MFECIKNGMKFKVSIEEPERPTARYEPPLIHGVDIAVKTQGRYKTKTGAPRGLIVHYTAGRPNAIGTLKSLADSRLGCLVMGEDGKIIKANNQSMNEVAWHAGKSKHPRYPDLSGMSRYCMGMEICNAGMLEGSGDRFRSWFGEYYDRSKVRYSHDRDNIKQGHYHKFTIEQEKSLLDFCLWQLDVNPEFEVDWVLGHDEVAPGRKTDPGAALSMSMPEFRALLKQRSGK